MSSFGDARVPPALAWLRALAGCWIRERFGESSVIVGPAVDSGIIGYYAQARYVSFPRTSGAEEILEVIERERPDAVVLPVDYAHAALLRPLLERPESFGVRRVDQQIFGHAETKLIVLARSEPKTSVAAAATKPKL